MTMKNCGNCLNCDKVLLGEEDEFWACELYGLKHGYAAPVNVIPPHDEACEDWSDTVRTDVDKLL
jgi:hypothetical protein